MPAAPSDRCGQCTHWSLKDSPTRQYGYGRCKVEPDPALRAGKTTSPQCVCRIQRFEKAGIKVIVMREKVLQG